MPLSSSFHELESLQDSYPSCSLSVDSACWVGPMGKGEHVMSHTWKLDWSSWTLNEADGQPNSQIEIKSLDKVFD